MDTTELISKLAINLSNNIYQDGLSPAVKNLGQALGDITSAIQLVTLPFAFLGDTAAALKDKYRDFINETALYNFYATSEVDEASLHKA